jgi:uncharacterized protein YigE (DUF2233 family)
VDGYSVLVERVVAAGTVTDKSVSTCHAHRSSRNLWLEMRRGWFVLLIVTVCALLIASLLRSQAAPPDSGFSLRILEYNGSRFTVATVDLTKVQLKLFWKDTNGKKLGSLAKLEAYLSRNKRTFLAGMNAGIFDTNFAPLGLHAERGRVLHPVKTRRSGYGNFYLQPNGVFYMDASGAHVTDTLEFTRSSKQVLEATQSGPALVLRGKLHPSFQAGSRNRLPRNAIGVSSVNTVQLVISDDWVNFYDLARFMRDVLKCSDALYLDGNISKLRVPNSRDEDGDFAGMIGVYR